MIGDAWRWRRAHRRRMRAYAEWRSEREFWMLFWRAMHEGTKGRS